MNLWSNNIYFVFVLIFFQKKKNEKTIYLKYCAEKMELNKNDIEPI